MAAAGRAGDGTAQSVGAGAGAGGSTGRDHSTGDKAGGEYEQEGIFGVFEKVECYQQIMPDFRMLLRRMDQSTEGKVLVDRKEVSAGI